MLVKGYLKFLLLPTFSFQSAGRTVFEICFSPPESKDFAHYTVSFIIFSWSSQSSLSQDCTYLNCIHTFKIASVFRKSPPCPAWKHSLDTHPTSLCTAKTPLISVIYLLKFHVQNKESLRRVKLTPEERNQGCHIKIRHIVGPSCASYLYDIVHIMW